MKHPKFRVASVTDLHPSVLDELSELFKAIADILPIKPLDVEICGSYPNASANLHSDFDIALPCKDWNEQILLRREFFGGNPKLYTDVMSIIHAYEVKYDVKIDLNPVVPDNKANTAYATYSLMERTLYNKPADLVHYYLAMSPYVQKYTLKPYERVGTALPVSSKFELKAYSEGAKYAYDQFASEVEEWRKIYGDKFLEYKVLPDGQLSE